MRPCNEEICDSLDAALFSGDDFFNPDSLKELEEYLARWQRRIEEIKKEVS